MKRFLIWVGGFLAASALPAAASCGLQSCPRPAGSGEVAMLEAGLRTRWVSYDIAGSEGSYLVAAPRVFVRRFGFAAGAEVPFTRLDNKGAASAGLSNPVLMIQYARRLSHAWSAEAGLQWELPFGDHAAGLAGDHMMLLPWLGTRVELGPSWYVSGMSGYSRALTHAEASAPSNPARLAKIAHDGPDHGEGPVWVNPHSDREAQWRLAVGWARGRSILEGFGLGQADLAEEATGSYVRAGASWEWTLARFTAVQVSADFPVTSNRRNEAEIGLNLKTGI